MGRSVNMSMKCLPRRGRRALSATANLIQGTLSAQVQCLRPMECYPSAPAGTCVLRSPQGVEPGLLLIGQRGIEVSEGRAYRFNGPCHRIETFSNSIKSV